MARPAGPSPILSTFLCTLSCSLVTVARLVNITVDDHDPSIQYAPVENHWLSLDQDCATCATAPDPSRVYNHTWHDATYNFTNPLQSAPQSFVFRFNGSAIYIYGILSSLADQSLDVLVFVDDGPATNIMYTGPETNASAVTYTYNELLYANTSLPLGEHAFELQNGQGDGGPTSLIPFDYLIYTAEVDDAMSTTSTSSTSSASSSPTSSNNSPVHNNSQTLAEVLPVTFLALLAVLVVLSTQWWRRWKKRKASMAMEVAQAEIDLLPPVTPFIPREDFMLDSTIYSGTSGGSPHDYPGVLLAKGQRRSETPPLYSSLVFVDREDDEAQSSLLLRPTNIAGGGREIATHETYSNFLLPAYHSDDGHRQSQEFGERVAVPGKSGRV